MYLYQDAGEINFEENLKETELDKQLEENKPSTGGVSVRSGQTFYLFNFFSCLISLLLMKKLKKMFDFSIEINQI